MRVAKGEEELQENSAKFRVGFPFREGAKFTTENTESTEKTEVNHGLTWITRIKTTKATADFAMNADGNRSGSSRQGM